MNKEKTLHPLWWLWLPLAFILIQAVLEAVLPQSVLMPIHSENGPHELLQFFTIFSAFLVSLSLLFSLSPKKEPLLFYWVLAATLSCFYVAAEEISWGQHFLDWSTPEYWSGYNDQNETNLHNTSSWLDQKPRLLLEIGVITGGLVIPLLRKFKPESLPVAFSSLYPPSLLSVVALVYVLVKIIEKTGEAFGLVIFERASEVEELYMFYFVLLYLLTLRKRERKKTDTENTDESVLS